jgi:predicted lipoprotein with Yx(FWY)xxD motif
MYRRLTALAAGLAMLALAACGSDGDSTSEAAVAEIDGFGDVLVDAEGMPLYTSDEEADGQIRCVDSCTSFWVPLEATDSSPSDVPGIGALEVVERPDGTQQFATGGQALYTFAQDSPGNVTGDGFSDDFGDQHLTWHVVRVGAAGAVTPSVTSDEASSDPADGGLYDYGG